MRLIDVVVDGIRADVEAKSAIFDPAHRHAVDHDAFELGPGVGEGDVASEFLRGLENGRSPGEYEIHLVGERHEPRALKMHRGLVVLECRDGGRERPGSVEKERVRKRALDGRVAAVARLVDRDADSPVLSDAIRAANIEQTAPAEILARLYLCLFTVQLKYRLLFDVAATELAAAIDTDEQFAFERGPLCSSIRGHKHQDRGSHTHRKLTHSHLVKRDRRSQHSGCAAHHNITRNAAHTCTNERLRREI